MMTQGISCGRTSRSQEKNSEQLHLRPEEIVPVVPRGAEAFNGGGEGRNAAAMTALEFLT